MHIFTAGQARKATFKALFSAGIGFRARKEGIVNNQTIQNPKAPKQSIRMINKNRPQQTYEEQVAPLQPRETYLPLRVHQQREKQVLELQIHFVVRDS